MSKSIQTIWQSSGLSVKVEGKSIRLMTAGNHLLLAHRQLTPDEMLKHTHTHFTYEILFAIKDRLTLVTEEGIEHYEHKVVIVPPGLKHCSLLQSGEGYCLLMLPQFEIHQEVEKGQRMPWVTELTDEISVYIRALAKEWSTGSEATEHLACLLMDRLFGALFHTTPESHPTSRHTSSIGIIESYINGHYTKNVTLKELSEVVHLCEKQVARIIKREYGTTLAQLLAQKRVGAAEMLLKNSDMKISEIAVKVSPTAENYFFTVFKQQKGMSPLQYRKAFQKTK